jgi:two-component system sensor histidine kinase KdpD
VAIPLKLINVSVPDIGNAILEVVKEKQITTICIGKPHLRLWQIILHTGIFNQLLRALTENDVDVVILS